MFIEAGCDMSLFAPAERNVPDVTVIALLWSFQVLCVGYAINIRSLRDWDKSSITKPGCKQPSKYARSLNV
jgi:hypothetical protein